MVRIAKKAERRAQFPRKTRKPSEKTGPLKDNLKAGFKPHANSLEGDVAVSMYISKIK
jgi:hypothetical protein